MAIDPISLALEVGGKIIDKIWPDPEKAEAAKFELFKMQQAGELAELNALVESDKAQAAVNQAEANNPSLLVSGWRPGAGWVCVAGLAYTYLLQPLLSWGSLIRGWPTPPSLDIEGIMALLVPLLGLGYYRTVEKRAGVARK